MAEKLEIFLGFPGPPFPGGNFLVLDFLFPGFPPGNVHLISTVQQVWFASCFNFESIPNVSLKYPYSSENATRRLTTNSSYRGKIGLFDAKPRCFSRVLNVILLKMHAEDL